MSSDVAGDGNGVGPLQLRSAVTDLHACIEIFEACAPDVTTRRRTTFATASVATAVTFAAHAATQTDPLEPAAADSRDVDNTRAAADRALLEQEIASLRRRLDAATSVVKVLERENAAASGKPIPMSPPDDRSRKRGGDADASPTPKAKKFSSSAASPPHPHGTTNDQTPPPRRDPNSPTKPASTRGPQLRVELIAKLLGAAASPPIIATRAQAAQRPPQHEGGDASKSAAQSRAASHHKAAAAGVPPSDPQQQHESQQQQHRSSSAAQRKPNRVDTHNPLARPMTLFSKSGNSWTKMMDDVPHSLKQRPLRQASDVDAAPHASVPPKTSPNVSRGVSPHGAGVAVDNTAGASATGVSYRAPGPRLGPSPTGVGASSSAAGTTTRPRVKGATGGAASLVRSALAEFHRGHAAAPATAGVHPTSSRANDGGSHGSSPQAVDPGAASR